MNLQIELSDAKGITVSGHVTPKVLRVLLPLVVTLPWVVQLLQAIGWM
jgi:hypothetical protein